MELRPDDIAEILRVFADSDLEELHLDIGGTRLDVSKRGSAGAPPSPPPAARPAAPAASPAPAETSNAAAPAEAPNPSAPAQAPDAAAPAEAPLEEGLVEVRSPLLGVFYRRPAPDKPPFVEVGSVVGADDPVCTIDVMKMFTQVPAGAAGTIAGIAAQDGQLVEHGQVLMTIRPA